MKRTAIQVTAWWTEVQRASVVAGPLDELLRAAGFVVTPGEDNQRDPQDRRTEVLVFGWSRVNLGDEPTWFGLCDSRFGPWMNLKVRTRRRAVVDVMEGLFHALVQLLPPDECSLVASNVDQYPVFRAAGAPPDSTGVMNYEGEATIPAGSPEWFRWVGEELRFATQDGWSAAASMRNVSRRARAGHLPRFPRGGCLMANGRRGGDARRLLRLRNDLTPTAGELFREHRQQRLRYLALLLFA